MNQRDGLSNENRRAFWQQAVALLQESGLTTSAFARREKLSPQTLNKWKIHFPGKDDRRQLVCGAYSIKGRIPAIHLHAEQLSWLHWMNIFTTTAQRHQDVVIAAARPRKLKNPWPAGLRTSCPPVAAAIPPFPPRLEINLCSLIIVH